MKKRNFPRKASNALRHALLKHKKKKRLKVQIERLKTERRDTQATVENQGAFAHQGSTLFRNGSSTVKKGKETAALKTFAEHAGGFFAEGAKRNAIYLRKTEKKIIRKEKQLDALKFRIGKKKK